MALDIATQELLAQLAASGARPVQDVTPAEARALGDSIAKMLDPGPGVVAITDSAVPLPDGTAIPVRVIKGVDAPSCVIVYLHGGGWLFGSLDEFEPVARELAVRTGSAVVLVGYRLAPEHPFPTAVDDCWAALQWVDANIEAVAGARSPVVVAGDSSGGNLAAVLAQRARARGGPQLALQVLVYPVTDASTDNESYRNRENQLMLTRETMIYFWEQYAPDPTTRGSSEASPARAGDLAGLPPAVVLLAEHDVLHQEGLEYAEALHAAGVDVDVDVVPGQMHGFFHFVGVLPGSATGLDQLAERINSRISATA